MGRVDEYGRLERVAENMKESRVTGNIVKVGECSGKCGGRLERFVGEYGQGWGSFRGGGRLGRVAESMGEGWDGLKGVEACRKVGDGCREYGGRLEGLKEV